MKIKDDSRKINKGDIFIALKKENDGHKHITEAIKNGASKIICEDGNYEVETLVVKNTHDFLVEYLEENYYKNIKDLKLIGVTGTNGKTTTCYLLYEAMKLNNIKCAYIGTIGFYLNKKVKDLKNTTPDILEIYEMLLICVENDIEYVIMEVSSHSLALNRIGNLKFKYGVFTNLTKDHLDYHKTMENYCLEKLKLFEKVEDKCFVNSDDEYKNKFINKISLTYGFEKSDYNISKCEFYLDKTTFYLNNEKYEMKLIGKHNVYNMVVVISILTELNLNTEVISFLDCPPGRMDIVRLKKNIIIIDYAHTPDAVSNILSTVKMLKHNKIITIIGCGGNRDKTKRPIMAAITSENSDHCIFTNDNPRFENQQEIIFDMVNLLEKTNYEIEYNREFAIKKGIQMLEKNDILLILGKGHETYQIINNEKFHFDDKEIVLKYT